ncbi:Asp-tRNA(Asn)/Glu-tRNA(Gln) amidotransferase subunit GatC [Candidatus Peregrinibacteria bacterium]|nr:Asp-tRNA(Asn)/Glu-tRNA(Gln) amidotransferase subunit GatC [Candidatus Peregrinibacteria bacterium]
MQLTRDQVIHVATLARLKLRDEEVEKFQGQLSGILDYVSQLNEVDTEGVEATAQVTGLKNVMREDRDENNILADPEALLGCSPLPIIERQIKVKNVF